MCTKYGIRNLNGKLCNTFFHCMSALMYMYIRPCIILHLFLLLMHYMIMFLYTLMILERMTDCHGLFLFRQFVVLTTRFSGLFLFRQDHFVITMLDISSAIHSKKVIFCCYLEKWGADSALGVRVSCDPVPHIDFKFYICKYICDVLEWVLKWGLRN